MLGLTSITLCIGYAWDEITAMVHGHVETRHASVSNRHNRPAAQGFVHFSTQLLVHQDICSGPHNYLCIQLVLTYSESPAAFLHLRKPVHMQI